MAYKSLITQVKNAGTIEKLVNGTPAQICCREDFRLHTVSLVPIFSSCSSPFSSLAFSGKDFREFLGTSR